MGRINRSKTREYGNPIPLTLRPNEVVTKRSHLEKEKEKRKDTLLKAIGEFLNGEPNESDSTIMSALQRGLQAQAEVVPPHAPTPSHEEHLRLQQKVAEQEATIKDLRDVVDKMMGIIKRMESSPQCTLQPAVQSTQSAVAVAQFDNSMDQTRCTERQQPAESRSRSSVTAKESGGEKRIDVQPIRAISIKREVEESEQEIGAHPSVDDAPNADSQLPTRKGRKSLDVQKEKERTVPSTPRAMADDIKSQIGQKANPVATTARVTAGGSLGFLADAYASPRTPGNNTQAVTIETDDFNSGVRQLPFRHRRMIATRINQFRVQNGQSGWKPRLTGNSSMDVTDLSDNQYNSVRTLLHRLVSENGANGRRLETQRIVQDKENTAANSGLVVEPASGRDEALLCEVNFNAYVRKLAEPSRKHIAAMINSFHNQNRQTWKPKLTSNSAMDVCDLSQKQWVKVRNRLHELIGFEKEMMEKQLGKSIETMRKFPEEAVKNSSVSPDETSATYDASITDVDVVIFPADHRKQIVQMINQYRAQNNQTAWKPIMSESDYSVDISDLSVTQLSALRKLVRELIGVNGFSITYVKQYFPCLLNF